MKNNTLIITYTASYRAKTIDGYKESFKCGSLDRAKEIVKARKVGLVKEAVYQENGVQYDAL